MHGPGFVANVQYGPRTGWHSASIRLWRRAAMESKSVTMELAPDARLAPRSLADVPGPRGWPLLGNLPQMTASRIHRDVEDWARRYGPLFKLRFGPLPVLVVARHESVNAVLRDRPDGFRRPRVTANVSDELGGRPGLFLAEGKACATSAAWSWPVSPRMRSRRISRRW